MNCLLHFAGKQVREVLNTLSESDRFGPLARGFVAQDDVYGQALAKLNEHFLPKKNATYERHIFRSLRQEKHENIELFVVRPQQAEKCYFKDQVDKNIRDQITETCTSAKLRRKILEHGDPGLEDIERNMTNG